MLTFHGGGYNHLLRDLFGHNPTNGFLSRNDTNYVNV